MEIPQSSGADREVLLVSADAELVAWVQGCAAGSGAGLRVVSERGEALARWLRHPLVLLGEDAVAAFEGHLPPHRPQVHLVARGGTAAAGARSTGAERERGSLTEAVRVAVGLGVQSVIERDSGSHTLTLLVEAVADPRPPGRVLAVAGGGAGAGASTTAAAIALVASRDRSVALLLPDPHGPDPWLLLGGEPAAGLTWGDVEAVGGAVAPVALRDTLARHRRVAVLGHGPHATTAPAGEVVAPLLRSARAAFDLVVVDVDPRLPQVWAETRAQADRLWMVVRPRAVGLASARARRALLGDDVRVLVRGAGVPDELAGRALGAPVTARMRDDRRLDEAIDVGAGPVEGRRTPLRVAAARVLADLERSGIGT